MSTKPRIVTCPWCRATNYVSKLHERGGRCRSCGHRCLDGLAYLTRKRREARAVETKRERLAARRALRASPEYQTMLRVRKAQQALTRAEKRVSYAWRQVRLAVDEHDPKALVSSTRLATRAYADLGRAQRRWQTLRQTATTSATPTVARAIILPDKEDS